MRRKGLSPLIATLLLIGFSVALGAIVMNWGKTYIEARADFVRDVSEISTGCSSVGMSVIKVNNENQICIDSSQQIIRAFLENGPAGEISNVMARIVGDSDVEEKLILRTALQPLQSRKVEIYHKPLGTVKQVTLTPVLENGGENKCIDQALVFDMPFKSCS